jgi:hypothetical protein
MLRRRLDDAEGAKVHLGVDVLVDGAVSLFGTSKVIGI